jgi:hypothetical protein
MLLCWIDETRIEDSDDLPRIVDLLSIIYGKYSESPAKDIVKERIL